MLSLYHQPVAELGTEAGEQVNAILMKRNGDELEPVAVLTDGHTGAKRLKPR